MVCHLFDHGAQCTHWTPEPGGCVVISTPGEANAQGYDGYLTNRTLNGQIAAQHNCATVVIEHRFFGESNPKPDLKSGSLKGLLTLEQGMSILSLSCCWC
jgi:hypothetical protein